MFEVYTNAICLSEKRYIIDLILNKFLGIEFVLIEDNSLTTIEIVKDGKKLIVNTGFFEQFKIEKWLSKETMPKSPLSVFSHTKHEQSPINLPVIYGKNEIVNTEKNTELGIDIFGSSFFMLSRYEELVVTEKDNHQRFSAYSSIAFKEGFLETPIIDRYIELLWKQIVLLWPMTSRKKTTTQFFISCDVDHISDKGVNFTGIFKRLAADLFRRKSLIQFFNSIKTFFTVSVFGNPSKDPFKTFDFMMDQCDKNSLKMAFYFIPRKSKKPIDGDYNIDSEEVLQIMKNIIERGHEVGYHGSYDSYNNQNRTIEEIALLKKVYAKAGGNPIDIKGGRQHYLRWQTGITEKNWVAAGMEYDSTLGYAERVGFRCGTSREYFFYDSINRVPISLIIRPLIMMEVSMFNEVYMNLNVDDSILLANKLIKDAVDTKLNFNLLWHNSTFKTKGEKTGFKKILSFSNKIKNNNLLD